jgi:hypothetical protein
MTENGMLVLTDEEKIEQLENENNHLKTKLSTQMKLI